MSYTDRLNDLTRDGLKALADSAVGEQLAYLGVGFDKALESEKVMKEVRKMFPKACVSGYTG